MATSPDPKQLAVELITAAEQGAPVEPFSARFGGFTREQADQVRQAWLALKIAAGGRIMGKKLGAVERKWKGKVQALEVAWGYILDSNLLVDGTTLPAGNVIQPRVEAELAFLMARDLAGPGVTAAQALAATAGVCPSFEVIDSRLVRKGTPEDAWADNLSHGYAVIGTRLAAAGALDLAAMNVRLEINGELKGSGTGAKIAGHPVHGLVALANQQALRAGDLILTGSVTGAFAVKAGDKVRAEFEGLGTITLNLE
jgi:2-keto-4-pentenoate hydratase